MEPTLLIGPCDWCARRMPKDEFDRRLDALWQKFPAAVRAVIYGDRRHHAELAYLTHFVPKLEAAAALLWRAGEHKLFLGGGPNMLDAARSLTFINDLSPLRGGKALGEAAVAGISGRAGAILMIGAGYMRTAFRRGMTDGIGSDNAAVDATTDLWTLMHRKSARELACIREASSLLGTAIAAIDQARRSGASVTAAILAGERAANRKGAQDVRTLFSVDGGKTLQPFTGLIAPAVDPLQLYIAVRLFNYWAEGFAVLSDRPSPQATKARDLLRSALRKIKAGTLARDVENLIAGAIGPHRPHPVAEGAFAAAIGLALDEPPHTDVAAFEAGASYSVRIGMTDRAEQHAIVSAMIAVRDDGNDVLWI